MPVDTYAQILAKQTERLPDGSQHGAWWHQVSQERIECRLCPRHCQLKAGDRGFCFVRENRDGELVLSTYGKSTGFCIDPIEKKPLNHFFPGTAVLSFGTAGCNLGCKFCQNWDISKSREVERLSALAEPDAIAQAALQGGCKSVAYTYNDPIIWAEYAIDTAKACKRLGIQNVAVTAGYITPEARPEFFEHMDAANVDLKAFTEDFYHKITYSHLQPVLDTLTYLKHETNVWFEITNLIIPDTNDNPGELRKMCGWILSSLGDDVPVHFTAFHPDFRMVDRRRTSPETLVIAQEIAWEEGLKYVYVGNVSDSTRQSTFCHQCKQVLIARNWYELGHYSISPEGTCSNCGTAIPGRFAASKGTWGSRRQPVKIPAAQPVCDSSSRAKTIANSESDASIRSNSFSVIPKERLVSNTPSDSPQPTTAPNPAAALDLHQLTRSQTSEVSKAAAHWLCAAVLNKSQVPPRVALGDLADKIVMGAFVTVKRGEILRGCCGVLGKPMTVGAAIQSAATKTASEDQRMAAVAPSELPYLDLDVTLLGPFKKIMADGAARADAVEIGKHGLMIQRHGRSGLLLPSVAVERGWNAVQFMQAVCNKAQISIGSWESTDAAVYTFDGKPMGGALKDLVAGDDLNVELSTPITKEDLAEYSKLAGNNIVALVSGGTPSYVAPHLPDATVNALVLSMQWTSGPTEVSNTPPEVSASEPAEESSDDEAPETGAADAKQGNLLQVSFRPGVPLQSTLFQMCQRAAQMFQVQRFVGQMQIGISAGFQPAHHGFGKLADLEGVDTSTHAIVISDPKHCGLTWNPEKSADELREDLREILPISSRDAAVHSMRVVSTMPRVSSISMPRPTRANGVRPPAVAGKFYPAEDAARRAMVGTLFKEDAPATSSPLAIMVPHAGIKFSGKIAARTWRCLESPENRPMIVISPKHTANGVNWSVCPYDSWRLSSTTHISGAPELAKQIADAVSPLEMDASAHQGEHGIEVQLPILERLAPQAQVVGLALNGGSWDDILAAATEFADFLETLPEMPLLVISSDMNHYAPDAENRRRDRLALDAFAECEPKKLIDVCRENEISMCGLVPAAFVLETLLQMGEELRVEEVGYATSAEVSGDKSQVVGYAGALIHAV